jgi:GntR family transcriptional repressor for pyruvate dehydrogenase complex
MIKWYYSHTVIPIPGSEGALSAPFDFDLDRPLLSEQVADRIQAMILSKSLSPGDRLPSERDLGAQLGVSRTVIREAMGVLKARGLIDARPGSGTYVKGGAPDRDSTSMSLLLNMRQVPKRYQDLSEVRRTLEVEIAGLAAERAQEQDIVAMESALEAMQAHAGEVERFTHHDLAFHSALTRATHNDLYGVLLRPIADLSLEFRVAAYHFDTQSAVEGALIHHRRILDMVKAKDPKGARQAMHDHLDQANSVMSAAQG